MKRCCIKTKVFKHCEIDSGFCINRNLSCFFVFQWVRLKFGVGGNFKLKLETRGMFGLGKKSAFPNHFLFMKSKGANYA